MTGRRHFLKVAAAGLVGSALSPELLAAPPLDGFEVRFKLRVKVGENWVDLIGWIENPCDFEKFEIDYQDGAEPIQVSVKGPAVHSNEEVTLD